MFKKFNEFLGESFTYTTIDFDVINEALTDEVDKKCKFGICMTTYKIGGDDGGVQGRAGSMTTPKVLKDSLNSIKDQSFDNYKVYLMGDGYPEDEWPEIESLAKSIIPEGKLHLQNRKEPGERGKYEGQIVHLTGGNTVANDSITQMKRDGIKLFARLDHDDAWSKDHLKIHAQMYTQFPETALGLTRARKKRVKGDVGSYMYFPESDNAEVEYDNHTLGLGGQCHSGLTWDMSKVGYLKYRTWDQQKSTDPRRKECFPGDWDNTERIKRIVEDDGNKHKMVYAPKLTVKYRNSNGKF